MLHITAFVFAVFAEFCSANDATAGDVLPRRNGASLFRREVGHSIPSVSKHSLDYEPSEGMDASLNSRPGKHQHDEEDMDNVPHTHPKHHWLHGSGMNDEVADHDDDLGSKGEEEHHRKHGGEHIHHADDEFTHSSGHHKHHDHDLANKGQRDFKLRSASLISRQQDFDSKPSEEFHFKPGKSEQDIDSEPSDGLDSSSSSRSSKRQRGEEDIENVPHNHDKHHGQHRSGKRYHHGHGMHHHNADDDEDIPRSRHHDHHVPEYGASLMQDTKPSDELDESMSSGPGKSRHDLGSERSDGEDMHHRQHGSGMKKKVADHDDDLGSKGAEEHHHKHGEMPIHHADDEFTHSSGHHKHHDYDSANKGARTESTPRSASLMQDTEPGDELDASMTSGSGKSKHDLDSERSDGEDMEGVPAGHHKHHRQHGSGMSDEVADHDDDIGSKGKGKPRRKHGEMPIHHADDEFTHTSGHHEHHGHDPANKDFKMRS